MIWSGRVWCGVVGAGWLAGWLAERSQMPEAEDVARGQRLWLTGMTVGGDDQTPRSQLSGGRGKGRASSQGVKASGPGLPKIEINQKSKEKENRRKMRGSIRDRDV